ncbi:MAG: 4Fe-4S dicluster domain-containing protein [Halalkalicoccus sp.]
MTETESQTLDAQMRAELDETDLGDEGVNLSMVIDLQRCTGCAACNIGCAQENNLQEGIAYSSRIITTEGEFPNVNYEYKPTLCNQCDDAPCASGCPTSALYKGEGGITMHNHEQCIGCKACIVNCPYDEIHFNTQDPHPAWESDEALIEAFRARVMARLVLLPPHDPQFRRNRERVNRDAERENFLLDWDLGYLEDN